MSSQTELIMTPRESTLISRTIGYIYTINETIISLNYCGGECYFRKSNPCHFYAFHQEKCFLGNFGFWNNEAVAGNSEKNTIYMNQGKIMLNQLVLAENHMEIRVLHHFFKHL